MSDQAGEWVTIADAARRLGMAERQARRWADRLPAEARRQEDLGNGRSRALVQLAALRALLSGHLSGQVSGQPEDPEPAQDGSAPEAAAAAAPGRNDREPAALTLALAMAVQRDGFERVISAQAEQIQDLRASLEHERENAQRWQEALAREQMLRALPALPDRNDREPEPADSPVEAPESTQGVGESVPQGPEPPQIKPQSQIRAFWGNVWQRVTGRG